MYKRQALIESTKTERDAAAREQIFVQAEMKVAEDMPVIPVYWRHEDYAVSEDVYKRQRNGQRHADDDYGKRVGQQMPRDDARRPRAHGFRRRNVFLLLERDDLAAHKARHRNPADERKMCIRDRSSDAVSSAAASAVVSSTAAEVCACCAA